MPNRKKSPRSDTARGSAPAVSRAYEIPPLNDYVRARDLEAGGSRLVDVRPFLSPDLAQLSRDTHAAAGWNATVEPTTAVGKRVEVALWLLIIRGKDDESSNSGGGH